MAADRLGRVLIMPGWGEGDRTLPAYLDTGSRLREQGYEVVFCSEEPSSHGKIVAAGFTTVSYASVRSKVLGAFQEILYHTPVLGYLASSFNLIVIRAEARRLVRRVRPDAAVLCSDEKRGAEYFVATMVPSAVLQVSFDSSGVVELKKLLKFAPFPSSPLYKKIAKFLPQSILNSFPVLGGEKTLAWKSLRRTLMLMLMGVPMRCARKGGCYAKKLCVNGPAFTEVFTSYGVLPEKIVATGSPEHDAFVEFFRKTPAAESRRLLGVGESCCSIFLQNMLADWGDYYFEEITELVQRMNTARIAETIILKAHPREPAEMLAPIANLPHVLLLKNIAPELNGHVLNVSTLTVTRSSTVGFQSIAGGIPLLTYNVGSDERKRNFGDYFAEMNRPYHALTWDAVTELLTKIKDATYRKNMIEWQKASFGRFVTFDSHATDRIADVVADLTRRTAVSQ